MRICGNADAQEWLSRLALGRCGGIPPPFTFPQIMKPDSKSKCWIECATHPEEEGPISHHSFISMFICVHLRFIFLFRVIWDCPRRSGGGEGEQAPPAGRAALRTPGNHHPLADHSALRGKEFARNGSPFRKMLPMRGLVPFP